MFVSMPAGYKKSLCYCILPMLSVFQKVYDSIQKKSIVIKLPEEKSALI